MLAGIFGPAIQSPEVHADGSVTFRLEAPWARRVEIEIGTDLQPLRLRRDTSQLWCATTPPLPPDLYCYRAVVDGVRQLDPSNSWIKHAYKGLGENLVWVPGSVQAGDLLWEGWDVPRGHVTHHYYRSAQIGDERDFYVYTPPGYSTQSVERYPLLCLIHGAGDDASGWFNAGCANVILDNLIATGRCVPMLVVTPLGFCVSEMSCGLQQAPWGTMRHNLEVFRNALLTEVLPEVEQSYAVSTDRKHRGIAGLSMGGAQALYVGLNHSDHFAHVGAFSPAVSMMENGFDADLPDLGKQASLMQQLWVACGRNDFLFDSNLQFIAFLKARGVPFTWTATDGAHNWPVWRRYLIEFVSQLFRKETSCINNP